MDLPVNVPTFLKKQIFQLRPHARSVAFKSESRLFGFCGLAGFALLLKVGYDDGAC